MPVQVRCPNPACGKSYSVPEQYVGRSLRCGGCDTKFLVGPEGATCETSGPLTGTAAEESPARIDRYEIRGRLGSGTFGTVYRAYDPRLDRDVAIKVLRAEVLDSPAAERFQREARAVAKLRHAHVVAVHDCGTDAGRPYIVYALVEGQSLADALPAGGLEPRRAAWLVARVADALACAHAAGILHRDVKPANVMLDHQGQPILVDFGLARHSASNLQTLSGPGALLGTPAYMAPEQITDAKDAGPASDQYSLGVTLYHLLTGSLPFTGPIASVIAQVLSQEAPAPRSLRRDLDPRLEAVCLKAMARRPEDRYPNAAAFATALDAWLADETQPAKAAAPPVVVRKSGAIPAVLPAGAAPAPRPPVKRPARPTPAPAPQGGPDDPVVEVVPVVEAVPPGAGTPARPRRRSEAVPAAAPKGKAAARPAPSAPRQGRRLFGRALAALLKHAVVVAFTLLAACYAWLAWVRGLMGLAPEQVALLISVVLLGPLGVVACLTALWRGQKTAWLLLPLLAGGAGALAYLLPPAWWVHVPFQPAAHTLKGHPGGVRAVAFDPTGKRLATAGGKQGDPGEVKLWDAATGRELLTLTGHTQAINSVAFSPDGRSLLTASDDDTVRLWDAETGKELRECGRHKGWVFAAVFRPPDGEQAASAGYDDTVKIWDLRRFGSAQRPLRQVPDGDKRFPSWWARCLAFSPDGRWLVTGGTGQLKLWDAATLEEKQSAPAHGAALTCVCFSPDGKFLASAGEDGAVRLWDAEKLLLLRTLSGHRGAVTGVAFSADGRRLVSGGRDEAVIVWGANTGEEQATFYARSVTAVAFSPDGKRVAAGCKDGRSRVWEVPAAGGPPAAPKPAPDTAKGGKGPEKERYEKAPHKKGGKGRP